MARCNDCGKFVSAELQDPEFTEDPSLGDDNTVLFSVRVFDACGECGTELREASFEGSLDFSTMFEAHKGEKPEIEHHIELDNCSVDQYETTEGKGKRYATLHGAEVTISVKCSCGKELELSWFDAIRVSHMETL